MKHSTLMPALLLGAILGLAPTARAETPKPSNACVLRDHRVTAVRAYYVEDRLGKIAIPRLRGAVLYVEAEPGLTREWLGLTITRHIARMRTSPMAGCPLAVGHVNVAVTSTDIGFAVTLAGKNAEEGSELLRLAMGFTR